MNAPVVLLLVVAVALGANVGLKFVLEKAGVREVGVKFTARSGLEVIYVREQSSYIQKWNPMPNQPQQME